MFLRKVLILADLNDGLENFSLNKSLMEINPRTIQTAAIIVTIIPVLCIYPFVQRFFVQGVMIGSIKG